MRLSVVTAFILIIYSCQEHKISLEDRRAIYPDALMRMDNHHLNAFDVETYHIYRYYADINMEYMTDTTTVDRKRMRINLADFPVPGRTLVWMDHFLDEKGQKYRTLSPDCGLIFSDINWTDNTSFYILCHWFCSSSLATLHKINYEFKKGKWKFEDIEFIKGT